jgi:hypothetical protein
MVMPAVFNFSNWKPQPASKIFNDSNDQTITNIVSGGNMPTGNGTEADSFITTNDYPNAFNQTNDVCDGDGATSSFIWYAATGFGDPNSNNDPVPLTVNLNLYPNTSKRFGIVMSDSQANIETFINDVLNSGDYINDLINHVIADPMNGAYTVASNPFDSVSLSPSTFGNTVFIMVFDLDSFGLPNPNCGDTFMFNADVQGQRASNPNAKPYPDLFTDVDFVINQDYNPPAFVDYPAYTFDYNAHFKMDRTVEDDLGATFNVSAIYVTFILLDDNHVFQSMVSVTDRVADQTYDPINDVYIVKFTSPINFNYGKFGEMLILLTYYTNAGVFYKSQTVETYASLQNQSVFPTGVFSQNQPPQFYIPIGNEDLVGVDQFLSGFSDVSISPGGLVNATYSSIVQPGTSTAVSYLTTNIQYTQTRFLGSAGNNTVTCNGISTNSGGQGTITYYVSLGSAKGITKFTRQNFTIPDRETIEMPVGTIVYDTYDLKSGFESVYIPKPAGVTQAKVTISAPLAGTAWLTTMSCAATSTNLSAGTNFLFSDQFPLSNLLVPVSGATYRQAQLDVDYSFVSANAPDQFNSGTYVANKNIVLYGDNVSLNGQLSRKLIYNDPFSGTPVYHMQLNMIYPGKLVQGNDQTHPTSGDIRIRRAFMQSSAYYLIVNTPGWFSNMSPYQPALYIPNASGKNPFNLIGGVEYANGNTRNSVSLSVNDKADIPIIDLLGYAYRIYATSHSIVTNPYQGNQGGPPILKSVGAAGGLYPDISGTNGILNQYYSQPFYHNETGDKFFAIRPTNIDGDGTISGGCGIIKITVTDSVNGTRTGQLGPIVGGTNVPTSASTMFLRFDGYNAETITMMISGCNTEMFGSNQFVYENPVDLSPGQSTTLSGSYILVAKSFPSLGSHAYTQATESVDFSASSTGNYPFIFNTYTALTPITVARGIVEPRVF